LASGQLAIPQINLFKCGLEGGVNIANDEYSSSRNYTVGCRISHARQYEAIRFSPSGTFQDNYLGMKYKTMGVSAEALLGNRHAFQIQTGVAYNRLTNGTPINSGISQEQKVFQPADYPTLVELPAMVRSKIKILAATKSSPPSSPISMWVKISVEILAPHTKATPPRPRTILPITKVTLQVPATLDL